jgi:hypothetical protein
MTDDHSTIAQIAAWRQRAIEGKMTDDELRSWIKHCREGRVAASVTSAKARARKTVSLDDMMGELDSIE